MTRRKAFSTVDRISRSLEQLPRPFAAWLVAGNCLVALLLCVATYFNLQAGRATDMARASDAVDGLAQSLSVEVAAELRLVDNALITVAHRVRASGWPLREGVPPALQAAVVEQRGLVPFVSAIRFADARGVVAPDGASAGLQVGDSDYFRRALQSDGAVLSEPQTVRGEWSLILARRLVHADGQVQGVVHAVIGVKHFHGLFSRLALGAEGAVTLRTASGRLAARFSAAEPESTKGYGGDAMSDTLRSLLGAGKDSGTYLAVTAVDGVERVNAFHRVPGFPLLVITGLSTQPYLAPWNEDGLRYWGFTLAVILLVAGGTAYVWLQHRRERSALLYAAQLATRQHALLENEQRLKGEVAMLLGRLQDFFDHAPCASYSLDRNARFVQANAVLLGWLGCTEEELLGKRGPADFFTEDSAARFHRNFPEFLRRGEIGPLEFDLVGPGGTVRHVSVRATAVRDAQGAYRFSRSVMYDVTELDAARRQLSVLAAQQQAMLDNDLVGILKVQDRRITWSNRASESLFGYGPQEMQGMPTRDLFPDAAAFEAFRRDAQEALRAAGHHRAQLELVKRDGSTVWVDVSGTSLSRDSDEYLWMSLDITALRRQYEQIEHAAFHDPLTGLPNRMLLMDRLRQAIQRCHRAQDALAVCYIDLDGFKRVNDHRGHAAGDVLLQQVAERILKEVRAHDTAARVGGDEFVILLPNLRGRDEAEEVVARLTRTIAQPVALKDGNAAHVGASVGIAVWPEDGPDEDALLAAADQAMYADKQGRAARVR